METNEVSDERAALFRAYKEQLDICAFFRWARLTSARQLLPDENGVRREVLRSRYLPADEAELPSSAIVGFIEKLGTYEALAEERARLLGRKLGLDNS